VAAIDSHFIQSMEASMFYPQGNFYSQGNLGYPQGGFGYPQGGFGSPQGGFGQPAFGQQAFGQQAFGQQGFQAAPNAIPFSNTLYGYPQLTPNFFAQSFAQSPPQVSNWQHLAQQQAALQLQALLQLLAPQLAAQSLTLQHPAGMGGIKEGINATANGIGQPVGGWQQPQSNPEQINPALLQQPQQQLQQPHQQLQRLAQYHHLVAQQFAHLAAQQAAQNFGNPYAAQLIPGNGQFVANQLGSNFVPGITMH